MPLGFEATLTPAEGTWRARGRRALVDRVAWFAKSVRVFIENKLAIVGVIIVIVPSSCSASSVHCCTTPTRPTPELALLNSTENAPPAHGHPLGTDDYGYDMLGRLMFGGQASLIVGLASAAVATLFGVIYGAVSGFFGSWIDAADDAHRRRASCRSRRCSC